MTVTELIAVLHQLEANGHGDKDVCMLQYNGGDDVACNVASAQVEPHSGLVILDA